MNTRIGICNACGARFKIPASFTPKAARCRECAGVVQIFDEGSEPTTPDSESSARTQQPVRRGEARGGRRDERATNAGASQSAREGRRGDGRRPQGRSGDVQRSDMRRDDPERRGQQQSGQQPRSQQQSDERPRDVRRGERPRDPHVVADERGAPRSERANERAPNRLAAPNDSVTSQAVTTDAATKAAATTDAAAEQRAVASIGTAQVVSSKTTSDTTSAESTSTPVKKKRSSKKRSIVPLLVLAAAIVGISIVLWLKHSAHAGETQAAPGHANSDSIRGPNEHEN